VTQQKESNLNNSNNNNNNNNRMKIIKIYRLNISLFQKFVSFADRASQCIISNDLINSGNLFYNKFIILLYMIRALYAHHREVKIVLYSIWYRHNCR